MRKYFCRIIVPVFALLLTIAPLHAQSQAPELDIPEVALSGNLLPMHIQQIEARVQYFADQIADAQAGDFAALESARNGLMETWTYSGSLRYHSEVAKAAAAKLTGLLDGDNRVKQINVALILANMPAPSIQPALETMISHKNPAVRYHGWAGYRAAWSRLTSQGSAAKKMFESIEKRLREETSPPVIAAMWKMLKLQGETATSIPGVGDPKQRALDMIRSAWLKNMEHVRDGDVAMLRAASSGLDTIMEYASAGMSANNEPQTQKAVQMLAELMWSAAKAYQEASRAGNPDGSVGHAAQSLLRQSEQALNDLFGYGALNKRNYIRFVLSDSSIKPEKRADAVIYFVNERTTKKYGVNAWVDELQERFNIEVPDEKMFENPSAESSENDEA